MSIVAPGLRPASVWTPVRDARLAELWGQGLTSRVIGERLGCGRDAVLGRARRLGLTARPNPNRRADDVTRQVSKAPARSRAGRPRRTGMPHGRPPQRWTEEEDARLAELWVAGMSSRLIGLALGRTRGTVRGRVERLKLPARPQPSADLPPEPVVPVVQLALLPVPAPPGPKPVPLRLWLVPTSPPRECQWPHGEPRTAGFRFCEAPALAGKPYCLAHARIAFVGFGRPRGEAGYSWVSP